jgi:hypothetical protein
MQPTEQPAYVIKLIERVSGLVVYDIETERGIVAFTAAKAQQRTEIVSNIRRALLRSMIGAEFIVQVLPAPEPEAPAVEAARVLSEARKRLCHSIFTTALEGGINDWSSCNSYHWAKPEASPEMSVDESADIDSFYAVIEETENPDEESGEYPKHRIDLAVIDRGIKRLASRECLCAGQPLEVYGRWHNLGLKLSVRSGDEDVDFDASDADAVVQAGLFNDIVYG